MRKTMLAGVMLALGAFSLHGALAEEAKQAAGEDEMQVTGTVTEVDEDNHVITVDGKEFKLAEQAGTAMMPAVGDKVSLFYEQQGDENMVTRIGQPQ